jgi:hypothetical protein
VPAAGRFVQTLAWSIDTVVWTEMVEIARWLHAEWALER